MSFLDSLPVTVMLWVRGTLSLYMPVWAMETVVGLLKVILAVVVAIMPVIVLTYGERKFLGRAQDRFGPNLAGPYGVIIAFADAIKMLTKEDVLPALADRHLFRLGPALAVIPPVLIFGVIPFGRGVVGADINVGVLYILAIGSIGALAVLTAGWASGNKYSLVSAFRSVAQLVSYEVPMALSVLAVVLASGTMSLVGITEAQSVPFVVSMPVAALIYLCCAFAEANRSPCDTLTSESDIIAGFNLEYSGMKFAMFYIGEYAHIFIIGCLTTVLFLGGYRGPVLPGWLWFAIKSGLVVFVVLWVRATWPRMRMDHLVSFAWKFLVPMALANLVLVACVYKIVTNAYAAAALSLIANVGLLVVTGAILVRAARRSENRALRAVVLGEV